MQTAPIEQKKTLALTFLASLLFLLAFSSLARTDVQQATVYVSPSAYTVPSVGSAFSLNISVQGVENLYGWGLNLYYPNGILNGTTIAEGPFLKTGGISTFFHVANFTDNPNATQGLVSIVCLRTDPQAPGVNGDGVLATVNFVSTSNDGPEGLQLDDVKLSDPNATSIPCTVVDGEVTVVPEYPTALILPLLTIVMLMTITLRKKIVNHRGIFHTA